MKANYKNWVPKILIVGMGLGTVLSVVALIIFGVCGLWVTQTWRIILSVLFVVATVGCGKTLQWSITAYRAFSYDGKRQLSREIIEGTAKYITLPDGGIGLDVGCGSGALTIACAKRNPKGRMVGVDRWGKDYAEFSLPLCQSNAKVEGVNNTSFQKGDATGLPFADESFDSVTSNYVYHNITGADKQELLLETLRVLKKGGTFAIHDLMGKNRYGDMVNSWKLFDDSEKAHPITEAEFIKVENIKGKLLLIGAEDDVLWDTAKYIRRMEKRLAERPHTCEVETAVYPYATHFVFPEGLMKIMLPVGASLFVKMAFQSAKKHPKECKSARVDIDRRITATIESWKKATI